jgi:four helix bundle protein
MGSSELEYHLLLAKDLKFLGPADHERLYAQVEEVKRMFASL